MFEAIQVLIHEHIDMFGDMPIAVYLGRNEYKMLVAIEINMNRRSGLSSGRITSYEGCMNKPSASAEMTLSEELMDAMKHYLLMHESDIAHEINDFGDLRLIFIGLLNRKPEI